MQNSSILKMRMEELTREIEILDKRIILMQDELAELDRVVSSYSATSIRNIIEERARQDETKEIKQAQG
jgi:hypothetical protein